MKVQDLLKRKKKQHTYCYCPKCGKDLVSSNSLVESKDGIVKYSCRRCENVSFWDFTHYPVPILRTCGDCHFLIDDGLGGVYCPMGCCGPDTQTAFFHKGTYCDYYMGSKPLILDDTNDKGITIRYPNYLMAYGYDIHGCGSNGLNVRIKYCPMCGRKLATEI